MLDSLSRFVDVHSDKEQQHFCRPPYWICDEVSVFTQRHQSSSFMRHSREMRAKNSCHKNTIATPYVQILRHTGYHFYILTWFGHDFQVFWGTVFVPVFVWGRFPYRGKGMIFWIFSCCPLSRVLHVTLANLQKNAFEFRLRSSPSVFSGCG